MATTWRSWAALAVGAARGLARVARPVPGFMLLSLGLLPTSSSHILAGAPGPRIMVPATTTARVVTDGMFSAGEWEGAFRQALGDKFEVYLMADSENLYVGFRFHEEVECTPFSEVYVATGDGRFLNLHSSGSLGEGLNDLPLEGGRTRFSVGNAVGWESNVARTPASLQGKEYRISRARLPGTTLRLAAFVSMVSVTLRESVSFPQDHGFGSTDAWAELVLPPPMGSRLGRPR